MSSYKPSVLLGSLGILGMTHRAGREDWLSADTPHTERRADEQEGAFVRQRLDRTLSERW